MRKLAFKLHSWLALICVLPLLVICLSGSILVFKEQIDHLLMPEQTLLKDANGPRIDADRLLSTINQRLPDYELGSWAMFDDHQQADAIYLIKRGTQDWYKAYLDPYRGRLLSQPVSITNDFTDWLLSLHYTLLLGNTGIFFSLLFSLVLITLALSGLVMYRQFYKRLLTLRWKKPLAVLFSDLHKLIGVTATPILLILGITGAYWNYVAFVHEVFEHSDEDKAWVLTERLYSDKISLQTMLDNSHQRLDQFTPTYLVMPYEPKGNISIFGYVQTGNPLLSNYNSGVIYNARSGDFMSLWDVRTGPFTRTLVDSFRRLHFGTFGGLTTRILWSLLGAAPLLLAISGLYLWWRKKRKRTQAQAKKRQRMANYQGAST